MTETAQRKGGGKPFRSILEPHFEFIRELRQRRKTWRQITELLLTEKGIRVTVFAPYLFYRRKLKRAGTNLVLFGQQMAEGPLSSPQQISCLPTTFGPQFKCARCRRVQFRHYQLNLGQSTILSTFQITEGHLILCRHMQE